MRKPMLFAVVAALTTGLANFITPKSEDPVVFKVVVVGKGVPENMDKPVLDCQTAGQDDMAGPKMWKGALAAWADSKPAWPAGQQIILVGRDDKGTKERAKEVARELEADPSVVAVIGHSASGTTIGAAEIYAQAGIPLIMPLATAQAAVFPADVRDDQLERTSARLSNCFRLPPSDDKGQAPAVAFMVEQLSPTKVHIVEYTKKPVDQYARPLCDKIQKILVDRGLKPDHDPPQQVESSDDMKGAASEISNDHDDKDVVVYCGNRSDGVFFLELLAESYKKHPQKKKPNLVFTDAAPNIEDLKEGFPVYRTGFYDARKCKNPSSELDKLIRSCPEVSSEPLFGYDAVRFTRQALKGCDKRVSRQCLLNELRDTPAFRGACFPYFLRDGENVISSYYVFRSRDARIIPNIVVENQLWGTPDKLPSQVISPLQIIQVTAK